VWNTLVPVICVVAGFGFATSAHDASGTELRAPAGVDLADVVRAAQGRVHDADANVSRLQQQIDAETKAAGNTNTDVQAAQAKVTPLRAPGGLSAAHGPGLTLVLDDAHQSIEGVDPNQLVVHQSDMQAAVNALWAGGAEAMSIAGQRVIATSAVRCVGNTLLLNGEVFSPPFRIVAIGPADSMQDALNASPGVKTYLQAAEYYGLGYTLEPEDDVSVPAYTAPISLSYAKPVGS
jgi:uncharacterized protein YlxW (UPF0749 family)